MIRFKNILFSKNKGFSLLGSLLGFSLLGLSTVGLATYMGNFEQTQVQYSEQSDVLFKHKTLLETMKAMLVGVQVKVNQSNKGLITSFKTQGICQLVTNAEDFNYGNIKDKFSCPIRIKKSNIKNGNLLGLTDSRWTYFLNEIGNRKWVIASGNECSGGNNGFFGDFTVSNKGDEFTKCLKFSKDNKSNMYARVKITPQTILNVDDSDPVDIDLLEYQLESVISLQNIKTENTEQTYAISKSEKLVLSSEVLECHICEDNSCSSLSKYVRARLSTSSLDSAIDEKFCYHSDINEPNICKALSIDYVSKNVLQAGQIASNTGIQEVILESDTAQNVASSCSSHVFRCKNDPSQFEEDEIFDPSIRITYGLYLDTFLKSSNIDSIDFKVGNWTLSALHDAGDGNSRVGRDSQNGKKTFKGKGNFWPLKSGGMEVTSYASVKNGDINICKNICEFHKNKKKIPNPKIHIFWNDAIGTACDKEFDLEHDKVQCTVCHTKNCHRYGVGTFGPVNELNNEPLDGSIPECIMHEKYTDNEYKHTDNENKHTIGGADIEENRCVKAKRPGFEAVSCGSGVGYRDNNAYTYNTGSSGKTLCFVNGESKILTGGSTDGLQALLNCQAPLKEVQKLGAPSNEGLWTSGLLPSLALAYNLPPFSSGTGTTIKSILDAAELPITQDAGKDVITIENNANMATYFGDSLKSDIEDGTWVNIQRDKAGVFHEGWPSMIKGGDWAFFYREPLDGVRYIDDVSAAIKSHSRPARPIFIKTNNTFHADYGYPDESNIEEEVGALLLTHHLKYRGLRGVKSVTTRTFPYLCRDISATADTLIQDIFKLSTTKGRNLSEGYQACRALGPNWYFIPPDSRKLWAAALQTVAPNAPRYSFPNPFNFVDGVPFYNSDGNLSFKYGELPIGDFLKSQNSAHYIVITENSGLLATPASAFVGLKPLVPSPKYYKSWDWGADWANLFEQGAVSDSSIYSNNVDLESKIKAIANNSITSDGNPSGLIDKAGNILTIAQTRKAIADDGNINQKLTKICISNNSNDDLWTHQNLVIRGTHQNWPESCSASKTDGGETIQALKGLNNKSFDVEAVKDLDLLEELTVDSMQKFSKGIRSIDVLLKFYKSRAFHIQNKVKFCHIWKAEKLRRATGQCMVKAYNSTNTSRGLSIGAQKKLLHSKAITERERTNGLSCHKENELCGGAKDYYQSLLNDTKALKTTINNNNTIGNIKTSHPYTRPGCQQSSYRQLVDQVAAIANATRRNQLLDARIDELAEVIKNTKTKCKDAVNSTLLDQTFYPSQLSNLDQAIQIRSDQFKYNFNRASDSRCWSIKKLNPQSSITYNAGESGTLNGSIGVIQDDTPGLKWNWNHNTRKHTDNLNSLKEDKYIDLPNIGNNNLCDDDNIHGFSVSYNDFVDDPSNCAAVTHASSQGASPVIIPSGGSQCRPTNN